MDLQQVLSSLEKADAAGDTQAAQALADLARSLMGGQQPVQPTPVKPAGFSLKDIGTAFGQGAVGSAEALTNVAGAGNAASQYLGGVSKSLGEQYTPERQAEMQRQQERMKKAEQSGSTLEEIKAAAQNIYEAPLQSVAQGVGSFVPYLPAIFAGPVAAALGLSTRAVAAANVAAKAYAPVVGTAQGAGAVKGAIYDAVYKAEIEDKVPEAEARQKAEAAQDYAGKNLDQIALGAGLGYVASKGGVEKFLTKEGREKAGEALLPRVGKAIGEESLTEGAQGGQERLASNLALQRTGRDVPTFQGVAGQAAQEGVIGGLTAGPVSAIGGRGPVEKPEVTPEAPSKVTPEVQPEAPPEVSPEQTRARVEDVTGVSREAAPSAQESAETFARTSRMEDEEGRAYADRVTQERLLRQQKEMDAEAERVAELNKKQGIQSPVPPAKTVEEKPSVYEGPPVLAKREDLLAKQTEVDKRRLEAGLPTGESSVTPGVQPEKPAFVEPKPTPKIVDERPLQERAAKNRLLVMRNMLQNQGGDPNSLTIAPHPKINDRFVIQSLDVPTKFTKNLPATAITRPESPAIIDPVNAYVEIQRRTNTLAARRFVSDFEAGKITREDVEIAIQQERKANQPPPLTYTPTGEPGIIAAETSKPRGNREVPVLGGQVTPAPEVTPEEPPTDEEPPAPTTTLPKTLEEFRQRMPIVSDKPEVRSANSAGNFSSLTQALQLSSNPTIKRIGELGAEIASKIKLRKPGKLGDGVLGVYRYADDSIQMIPSHAGDEHTNAHETVHALISKAQRYPTDRQKPVVAQIEELYQHVKKELSRKGITAYGLANPREFTAEAMTNPQFQFELMQIPYRGKRSAWSQFTKLVADLLGIQNTNALTEVLNLVDRLATQKQPRKTVADKGLVDEMTDEQDAAQQQPEKVEKKSLAVTAKEKAQELLQKRKPINKEGLAHVNDPEYVARLGKVFNPRSNTIIDKIEGMKDGFWRRTAQGLADQYRTIKDYDMRSYMLARMSKTQDGGLEGLMFNGHIFNDGGALNIKKNTKGLMEALKPVGNEVDSYMMWIALNRESNLAEGKKSPELSELAIERDKLSQGMLNGKPRIEVYKSVQEDMNALNKSVLDIALDMGLINSSKREIAELESREGMDEKKKAERIAYLKEHPGAYEKFTRDVFYIPFYRMMEDGDIESAVSSAGLTKQKFSAELKGMNVKPFADLMENTLRNWSHILSASMKNQAAVSTIEATMEAGAVIPNMKAGLAYQDGQVISTKSGEVVGDGKLRPEYTESTTGMASLTKVMKDGQPMYFEVLDPMLLDSITSIGYMGPKSKFLDVARDFKNMLQFGVTISPAFKVNNLIRDSISAMAVSDLKKSPVANVVEGIGLANKDNPTYIEALAGGAIFNFGSTYEGDQAKLVKRLLKQGVKAEHILDTKDKIEAGLKGLWDKYQELGNKSEAANRLALYKQMRDKGMSHLEASFQARDLLDFSMQGSWPAFRTVTQVVPFLNARVQGLYKLGRDGVMPTSRVLYNTITGKEIEATDKQKAYSFGIVTTAVSLASMALYMTFKDDEDYKKRDEWDRDNFWWIKLPNMDYALRVPKPFEIGAFGTMSERILEQIIDQGAEGKTFGDSISRMLFDTFAMNPVPQMFKPLLDLYANKDSFSGSPIESAGMERLSKQERMTEQTSPLAKALGGMTQILGEKGELSPAQVDYAIKGYFGWLGATATATSMYAVMPFKEGAYPDTNWMDKASLGLARTLPSNQSKYTTAFYDANKEIGQAFSDMRHYADIGDSEKVQQLLEEKGDKIRLSKLYDKTAKNMANVRKQIRIIMNDDTLDGATKKAEIDRMKEIISMYAEQAESVRKSLK